MAEDSQQPPRILIVDDEADARLLARVMLNTGPRRYEIHESGRGKEALAQVPALKPDVVLLDVELPDMDGMSVLQALRGDPETSATKVVLVTGHADSQVLESGRLAGADDHVVKPFTPQKLVELVERLIAASPRRRDRIS